MVLSLIWMEISKYRLPKVMYLKYLISVMPPKAITLANAQPLKVTLGEDTQVLIKNEYKKVHLSLLFFTNCCIEKTRENKE